MRQNENGVSPVKIALGELPIRPFIEEDEKYFDYPEMFGLVVAYRKSAQRKIANVSAAVSVEILTQLANVSDQSVSFQFCLICQYVLNNLSVMTPIKSTS